MISCQRDSIIYSKGKPTWKLKSTVFLWANRFNPRLPEETVVATPMVHHGQLADIATNCNSLKGALWATVPGGLSQPPAAANKIADYRGRQPTNDATNLQPTRFLNDYCCG